VENPHKVLYGHIPGFRLSALGRAQAAAVGQSLRSEGIARIVHSPLERAMETAEIIASQLAPPPELEADLKLTEAEFSRYLQGVPYWQVPIRRPLRWGLVPGDESIETMGKRILAVAARVAAEHPGEPAALVSHADPLIAVWILLDRRPENEREMHRKVIDKAGMLRLEMDGATPVSWEYVPAPRVDRPATAAA